VSGLAVLTLMASAGYSALLLACVLALLWYMDRYDSDPVHLVAGLFLWGAVVVPLLMSALTIAVDDVFGGALVTQSTLWVSAIGESLKAIGVLLVVSIARGFDNPTEGVVYGTAVGLGCAVSESALFEMATGSAQTAPGWIGVAHVVSTAASHATAGAIFGGCLGVARLSRPGAARVIRVCGGLAAAVGVRWAWQLASAQLTVVDAATRPWLLAICVLYGLYFAVIAGILNSEHRVLKKRLQEEVELATVPPWVIDVIPYYRRRVRSDWWPFWRERTALSRLLTKLAFRKHAILHLPEDEAQLSGLELVQLRNRIRQVLGPPPVRRTS
jgi:RsiW-degrading membrane proteinase PrsW (M82 family)